MAETLVIGGQQQAWGEGSRGGGHRVGVGHRASGQASFSERPQFPLSVKQEKVISNL